MVSSCSSSDNTVIASKSIYLSKRGISDNGNIKEVIYPIDLFCFKTMYLGLKLEKKSFPFLAAKQIKYVSVPICNSLIM